ncbi:MAG: hypothetical protein Q4Q17_04650 [Tissierellia bacterium]|nr:hypothetical protein [Tissierellia bacterium]
MKQNTPVNPYLPESKAPLIFQWVLFAITYFVILAPRILSFDKIIILTKPILLLEITLGLLALTPKFADKLFQYRTEHSLWIGVVDGFLIYAMMSNTILPAFIS